MLLLEGPVAQPSEENDDSAAHVLVDEGEADGKANGGGEGNGEVDSLPVRVCGDARRDRGGCGEVW